MACVMETAYRLRRNTSFIASVQKATLSTEEFGIEQTHGLFGSAQWWEQISSGKLPLHTLCGVIVERFWGSMGDWPEIRVRNEDGQISQWTREANTKEQDALYIPGQRIEIDYVVQRHRPKSFDKGAETKVVIEIRVELNVEMKTPGTFEKLRARELAQAISWNYPIIIDASHQLSELGNVPSVMDEEAHLVFTSVAREVEGVIAKKKKATMEEVLNRWREPVLAACHRMLDTER